MKKKPTKGTRSNKNEVKPRNALREFWLQSKGKDWLIEKINKAERWARAEEEYSKSLEDKILSKEKKVRLLSKIGGMRSGEIRRRDHPEYKGYDWWEIRERGEKIKNKHPSYTRHRIAKIIYDGEERAFISDKIPSLRAIWKHLDFIPTSKRTPK